MLSRDPACAFVHIPKTGGSSIELLLTGHDWITGSPEEYATYRAERHRYRSDWGGTLCDGDSGYFTRHLARKHASQARLREELGPEAWRSTFKFTFVRNPWERLLSIFDHGHRDGPERMPASLGEWLAAEEPLDHMGQPVLQPLIDNWDELDFVGRFEHFAEDFARVARALGLSGAAARLPHERHGSRGPHDLTRYDERSIALVARRCAEEIARFGYRFEGTPAPAGHPPT